MGLEIEVDKESVGGCFSPTFFARDSHAGEGRIQNIGIALMNRQVGTIRFILGHPLGRRDRVGALKRYIRWQIGSRVLAKPVVIDFVGGARLVVSAGMTGATGNIYTGLHEFGNMAFVLHALRREDTFVDVGANVGTYTIIASAAVGATTISLEPIPAAFRHLVDNVGLNGVGEIVDCLNIAAGRSAGTLQFTTEEDTTNHVLAEHEESGAVTTVEVKPLDDLVPSSLPCLVKIDVEGWENEVVAGADGLLSTASPLAIVMEMSGDRYGFDATALHHRMLDYGFETFSYNPFQRTLHSLNCQRNPRADTIYIKEHLFFAERVRTSSYYSLLGAQL